MKYRQLTLWRDDEDNKPNNIMGSIKGIEKMSKPYAVKFYASSKWKKCRASYIESVNGLCQRCLKNGKYVPGYIVHHKKPITPMNINDPDITLNHKNLEYVCKTCHNIEHYGSGVTREDVKFDINGELIER